MYHIFFIHPFFSWWIYRFFYFLAIMKSATINMDLQMPVWYFDFIFLAIHPGVELLGHMVLQFLILEDHRCHFPYEYTNLYFYQHTRVLFSPHPCQHLLSFVFCLFLIIAILTRVRWYLLVASIWIFLILSIYSKPVGHLYIFWEMSI
jgi:hypothetical protein